MKHENGTRNVEFSMSPFEKAKTHCMLFIILNIILCPQKVGWFNSVPVKIIIGR